MPADPETLARIALAPEEYDLACRRLGREPNEVELGMIGALWSEHCGYKNSKLLLRRFPTEGPAVLTKLGEENAGAVDIGDGWCAVMKVESHNHPSAVEPFQGAATGVGGIVRDIFAMGARPIAILDSLRFGPLEDDRTRYLFGGVVGGIGWYGNCLGVPTVGGETCFDAAYRENPLVNALCVGVARVGRLVRARADGPGNVLLLVGADTGRDGIHGATFASAALDEASEERRPAVQVGNPFMEKLLMEACIELVQHNWIVGLQDLGAAGLTSSAVECAARAGTGVELDVLRVPRRERGMSAHDVMLSESQERMLVIAKREHVEEVRGLFQRWELHCAEVGVVTDTGEAVVREGERVAARLPVGMLVDPPLYRRQGARPAELAERNAYDLAALLDLRPEDATARLREMLGAPNVCAKRWVWRQYDHQVLTNTVQGPGGDAAVLRIRGSKRGIAIATDGNGRTVELDPFTGGALAVAEAARNVSCTGARPVACTDCLNFGDPLRPEVYYQLEQAVEGMAAACRALGTPVVSGNVSLYNETVGRAIAPTPVAGVLGVLEDVSRAVPAGFAGEGDAVYLLGADPSGEPADLAGSEYLHELYGLVVGMPRLDLELEARLQRLLVRLAEDGVARSAHDCAEGGLAVCLAESALLGEVGVDCSGMTLAGRLDAALFGERPSRAVVSARPSDAARLEALAGEHGVPCTRIGTTGGDGVAVGPAALPLDEAWAHWETALAARLGASPVLAAAGGAPAGEPSVTPGPPSET